MKYKKIFFSLALIAAIGLPLFLFTAFQKPVGEPWTEKQLLAPEALAQIIGNPQAEKPIILSVGPGAVIKGSLDMGAAHEKANYEKLKRELEKLPKDADIVIYCGCCPFEHRRPLRALAADRGRREPARVWHRPNRASPPRPALCANPPGARRRPCGRSAMPAKCRCRTCA